MESICKMNNNALKRKLSEDATPRPTKVSCIDLGTGTFSGSCTNGCDCRLRQPKLADNCLNYLNSCLPRRILFYDQGQWFDFPEPVRHSLIDGFKNEKSCSKVIMGEDTVLVDFLSMAMVNLRTRKQHSVAWIDEFDKCFFPNLFSDAEVDDDSRKSLSNARIYGLTDAGKSGYVPPHVVRQVIMEHGDLVPKRPLNPGQRSKMENVERDSQTFLFVRNLFLSGMGQYAAANNVLKIQRYVPKDIHSRKRLVAFERRIRLRREELGDANVKYGWFGANKRAMAKILVQGFGMEANPLEGAALGNGTYLMPENRAFASVKLCDVDEKGIQHILLCRIILGNMEEVKPGSNESFSGSNEFDSVVDDRLCPKFYMLRPNSVYSYIHPEYLISFKLAPKIREYLLGSNDAWLATKPLKCKEKFFQPGGSEPVNGPTSSWISFPVLLSEVEEKISPTGKKLLYEHYTDFKRYKITREYFITKTREIVGDELILSVLEKLKQCPSAWKNGSPARGRSAGSPESVSVELTLGLTDSSSLNIECATYASGKVNCNDFTAPTDVDSNPASFSMTKRDSYGQKIEYDVSSALSMALANEVTAGEMVSVDRVGMEVNDPASVTVESHVVVSLPAAPLPKG